MCMRFIIFLLILLFVSGQKVSAQTAIDEQLSTILKQSDYTSPAFLEQFQILTTRDFSKQSLSVRAKWLIIQSIYASYHGDTVVHEKAIAGINQLDFAQLDAGLVFSLKSQLFFYAVRMEESIKAYRLGKQLINQVPEGVELSTLGYVFVDLAHVATTLGLVDETWPLLEKGKVIAQQIGDKELSIAVVHNQGMINNSLREFENSRDDFERALALVSEHFPHIPRSVYQANIAHANFKIGDLQQAEAMAIASLESAKKEGNRYNMVFALSTLSGTAEAGRKFEKAIDLQQEMLDIAEDLNLTQRVIYGQLDLVETYILAKKVTQADELLKATLIQAEQAGLMIDDIALPKQAKIAFLLNQQALSQSLWQQSLRAVKDKFNLDMAQTLSMNKSLLELDRKDSQLKLLTLKEQAQQERIEQVKQANRYLVLIVVLLIALVLLAIISGNKILSIARTNKRLATTDELTNINNRRAITEKLQNLLTAQPFNHLAVMMLDVDFFKKVNDNFGHDMGDLVLQTISHTCESLCDKSSFVGRLGGEEFLFLYPCQDVNSAIVKADEIRLAIEEIDFSEDFGQAHKVTLSIGVYFITQQMDDMASVLNRADHALYEAKAAGRNQVMLYQGH